MAQRLTRRFSPLLVLLTLLGAALALIPAMAHASPTPNVTDVQKKLGALAVQSSQLVEKYDQAQVQVQRTQNAAKAAKAQAAAAASSYDQARSHLGAAITAEYEGGSFSSTGALLTSDSGDSYLESLNTLTMISQHTAQVVHQLSAAKSAATTAAHKADMLAADAQKRRDKLAGQRTAVTAQIAKYQQLLGTLNSAQRSDYLRAANPSVAPATYTGKVFAGGSKAAQVAVKFALSQVGKPYVFGAAGPDSYDCSGLTMASYAAAGISLPHSAADQYNYGTHVSMDALAPGDLIFMYQPIGHVTIYIGGGMMVSAPQSGENVSVIPVSAFNGQIVGATRLT